MNYELIENLFCTFEQEFNGNFQKIISELYKFLKENNISNQEIRINLHEFFIQNKNYMFCEYNLTFRDIRYIIESLINEYEELSNNISFGPLRDGSQSGGSQRYLNNHSLNNLQSGQPLIYNSPTIVYFSSINRSPESDIINIFNSTNMRSRYNLFNDDHLYNSYVNQSQFNLVLDMFNILLNNPSHNIPYNNEDVKNVINKDQLNKLKIKKYSELDKEKYKECVICMEDYKNNSDVRLLNCNHGFHPSCIDTWLTKCNYKCPVCRDSSNEHHAEV
uniref:RING-type domain-containing protein n=1 Tax=viral metagenome TaxID=1070528 RepID=A0A6C0H0D4_9ZZZZ